MIPYSKLAPSPSSLLPPELLQLIAAKLTDIVDYVSFRGVCSAWRLAAKPGDAPKQLPWLLLPYSPASPARSFHSLSAAKTYTSDCAAAVVGRVVCGSSFGWLALVAPDSSLSLLNPITRAVIELPPPTGFPSYLGPEAPRVLAELNSHEVDEHCFPISLGYIRPGYPCRVSLSSSPSSPECVVLVVLASSTAFAYCRIGEQVWTIRETNLSDHVNSVVLRDGMFYALDSYGAGVVLDVHDPSARSEIPLSYGALPLLGTFVTKAAGDDGELYMVQRYIWFDEEEEEVNRVDVFKMVSAEGRHRWERVCGVGDLAFFLSGNHASVVRATDFPRGRGNHVYFSEGTCGDLEELRTEHHEMYVYNIKRDRFQLLLCPMKAVSDFSRSPTWITPSLL